MADKNCHFGIYFYCGTIGTPFDIMLASLQHSSVIPSAAE